MLDCPSNPEETSVRRTGSAGPAFLSHPLTDVAQMQDFSVDLEARQVVDWVLAELRATPSAFKVRATRTAEVRQNAAQK
jgi:hypothetical protein